MIRQMAVVCSAALAAIVLAAPSASAEGGGSNQGTIGVVYNTVTVGGIRFSGMCTYHIDATGLMISGQASAAGTVISTTLVCEVRHGAFATPASKSSPGPATTMLSLGHVPVLGTGVCITMSAHGDSGTVSPTRFCV